MLKPDNGIKIRSRKRELTIGVRHIANIDILERGLFNQSISIAPISTRQNNQIVE